MVAPGLNSSFASLLAMPFDLFSVFIITSIYSINRKYYAILQEGNSCRICSAIWGSLAPDTSLMWVFYAFNRVTSRLRCRTIIGEKGPRSPYNCSCRTLLLKVQVVQEIDSPFTEKIFCLGLCRVLWKLLE